MKEKVFSDWYHQTRDITARAGFDAAWQHQQAKVEELQKRVIELEGEILLKTLSLFEKTFQENQELKTRLDYVWKVLESFKDKVSGSYNERRIDELVALLKDQALKGKV